MLELPHPLLADDIHVERPVGRSGHRKEHARPPHENHQHEQEGDHRPDNLEHRPAGNAGTHGVGRPPAVSHRIPQNQAGDQQREERGDAEEKEIQRVDAWCHRRSGLWKQGGSSHSYSALVRTAGTGWLVRRCVAPCGGPTEAIATHHDGDERGQNENRRAAGESQGPHHHEAVPTRHRIVVITIEEERVDGPADPAGRRLDEREPEIARSVLEAEQVTREPAVRRQDDKPRRMGELPRLLIPHISEPGCLRQALDRRLVTSQEMQAVRRILALVSPEQGRLVRRRDRRSLPGIEADHDNLEVPCGLQRQHVQAADHRVQHPAAQHRTVVVSEGHHDRLDSEVLAETHDLSLFIPELDVERHLMIQVLVEANLAQRRRNHGGREARFHPIPGRRGAGHLRGTHDHRGAGKDCRREHYPRSSAPAPNVVSWRSWLR